MNNETTGIIYGINGPVIYIEGKTSFRMGEMVYVGKQRLVGEVIRLDDKRTTIQVYEETSGLKPGEEVISTGAAIIRSTQRFLRRSSSASGTETGCF